MLYVFGEWTLDTQRYELCHAGHVRRLRRKAFQVLTYLLAHADRVVTKQELCEQVWPQQFISDAALESTIKAVRQALLERSAPRLPQCLLTSWTSSPRRGRPSRPSLGCPTPNGGSSPSWCATSGPNPHWPGTWTRTTSMPCSVPTRRRVLASSSSLMARSLSIVGRSSSSTLAIRRPMTMMPSGPSAPASRL